MHRIVPQAAPAPAVRCTPPRCIYDAHGLSYVLPSPPLPECGMRRRAESRPLHLPATMRVEDGLTPRASPGTKSTLRPRQLLSHSLSPAVRGVRGAESSIRDRELCLQLFCGCLRRCPPRSPPRRPLSPGMAWFGYSRQAAVPSQPGELVTTDYCWGRRRRSGALAEVRWGRRRRIITRRVRLRLS